MKENEADFYSFANPICKQTYQSLPKIYGGNRKPKPQTKRQSLASPHRHKCVSQTQQQIQKLPTNKKYSQSKSRYLSMPKAQKCSKKYCSCNLIHQQDPKTLRKNNSPKRKIKLKLKPIPYAKPDDFQSEHKVAMKICTQPNMPTGLALIIGSQRNPVPQKKINTSENQNSFINEIMDDQDQNQTKRHTILQKHKNQHKTKSIPRSFTQQIAIGTDDHAHPIESAPYSFQQTILSRATSVLKQVACVQVQVNLIDDAIEKRSQKQSQIQQVTKQIRKGSQAYSSNQPNSIRNRMDHQRFKKLSRARKTKFYISEQEDNQQSQIYQQDERKRQKQNSKQQGLTNSRKTQSSLSLTSCLVKGLNSQQTEFKKLTTRQNKQSLKVSRAKSTKSNGTFRVPTQEDYIAYLKGYNVIDKKNFNLKQLVKKPLFSIVQEEQGVYFGEYEGQIKNGTGIRVTEKQIFEGVYQKNIKIKGCERNIDGVYKGYFLNGKREGYGTFQWNNGQKFQGNWKDGVKCGFGIWRSPKGDSYQGEWMNNRQHGQGVFKHRNSSYKGEFQNFLKHGKGTQKFINGDTYQGDYKFGKPDGFGTYNWYDGGSYQGQFKSGIRNGKGKLIEVNGNIYEGQFNEDSKQGKGIQFFKNGDYFEGQFRKNSIYKGTLHKKQGRSEFVDNS